MRGQTNESQLRRVRLSFKTCQLERDTVKSLVEVTTIDDEGRTVSSGVRTTWWDPPHTLRYVSQQQVNLRSSYIKKNVCDTIKKESSLVRTQPKVGGITCHYATRNGCDTHTQGKSLIILIRGGFFPSFLAVKMKEDD